jgi:hypothetical protein
MFHISVLSLPWYHNAEAAHEKKLSDVLAVVLIVRNLDATHLVAKPGHAEKRLNTLKTQTHLVLPFTNNG